MAAAVQLRESVKEGIRVRIDPDARTPEQTALIAALRRYERARSALKGPDLSPLASEIGRRLDLAARGASRPRMLFTFSGRKKQEAHDALTELDAILSSKPVTAARKRLSRAEAELEKAGKEQRATRLWNDYLARPVTYNGLLIEVAELDPAREASQGFLPADIAEQVRVLPLDRSLLKTSLRGYQAFGAKFALVQERVILGDEMGLGKTMQSLAAMCHLAAKGATHFLVVCPASVVINWTREVERHTLLEARRLHLPGARRQAAEQEWAAKGGVAVTTFEALRAMPEDLDVPVAMMVVDEAHYAKNPNALRTQAVSEWAGRSRRVAVPDRDADGEQGGGVPGAGRAPAPGGRREPGPRGRGAGRHQVPGAGRAGLPAAQPGRRAQRTAGPAGDAGVGGARGSGACARTGRRSPKGTSWRCAGPRSTRERSRDRRSSGGWWRSSARRPTAGARSSCSRTSATCLRR